MNLDKGEIICHKCEGNGYSEDFMSIHKGADLIKIYKRCPKCKGYGKLDWIEAIVGKKISYVKPGIYTKEVDLSYITKEDNIWKLV